MPFNLTFSQHARTKLEQRNLSETTLRKVLEKPETRFYDTISRAQIAIGIMAQATDTNLAVVYRRKDADNYHIVTAYPIKELGDEVRRKVKVGRCLGDGFPFAQEPNLEDKLRP